MAGLFFAYSRQDEALRDELEVHLATLKRQGLIEAWHDRRIGAGEDWEERISEHLEAADVILLLISPDFIASDYCYGVELKRALERHQEGSARVIPVILRPCAWQDLPFGGLQATPQDGRPVTTFPNRDEALLQVTQAVKKALKSFGGAPSSGHGSSSKSGGSVPVAQEPRSSNLRVRKAFTQRDKDRFLTESFEYIAKFFENSLAELEARNETIDTSFRRVDANTFDAAIYRDGEIESRCRIWMAEGAGFPRGILYSTGGDGGFGHGTSFNEQVSVEADDQKLYLKPSGLAVLQGGHRDELAQQGAAEYLWGMLVEPLQ